MNIQLKMKKTHLNKGKITKSCITFCDNKPNFINPEVGVSSFETGKYEILHAWRSKKSNPIQTQFKPIQTQFKPNAKKAKNEPKYLLYKGI